MKAFTKWRREKEEQGIEQGYAYANADGWMGALKWICSKMGNSPGEDRLRRIIKKEISSMDK